MSQSVTTKTEQGLYVHPEALTAHLPALDYRDGALYMEQVSIDEVVKHYGTPENTTRSAFPPAANTRINSPRETISNPAPACAKMPSTARLEFAFTA